MTPLEGDIATLYLAPGGVLKLARDPADNDLILREAGALGWLATHGEPRFLPYLPAFLGTGGYRDPATSTVRRGNALAALDGFRDLAFIGRRFPEGLDPRDVAWIWRRLLVALGFAHRAGIVHGAVLPPHVLIETEEHGLTLVDWCYATGGPRPGRLPAMVAAYRDWYPPEVRSGYVPAPDLDIYLAATCMLTLLGGTETPLTAFAKGSLLANPRRRPDDAWALLRELDDLLQRAYGPRRFRRFPAIA